MYSSGRTGTCPMDQDLITCARDGSLWPLHHRHIPYRPYTANPLLSLLSFDQAALKEKP